MFKKNYAIRYSDLDSHMCVSMTTLLEMFQDVSVCHSAATGFGLQELQKNGVAWLLQGWRIKVFRKPEYPGPIEVCTGVTEVRTVYGYRDYRVIDQGEVAAIGKATWFMYDLKKMRPCRVKENILQSYQMIENEYPDFVMKKLLPEQDLEEKMRFRVLRKELDTNHHLNNVKSFQLLTEILPEDFVYNEILITYRRSASYGEELSAMMKPIDHGYHCELRNQDQQSCVIVRFLKS